MNLIVIMGNLTADPELGQTASGTAFCNFNVAVTRPFTSDDPKTDFFKVVAWGSRAETLARYFHKGDKILVRGSMQMSKFDDSEGKRRTDWKLHLDDFEFCRNKSSNSEETFDSSEEAHKAAKEGISGFDEDDDIPF